MRSRFIWSNSYADFINDIGFESAFLANNGEVMTNPDVDWISMKSRFAEELLDIELSDLCGSFDIDVGKILCLSDVQTEDGPKRSERVLHGTTIADCFTEVSDEKIIFYISGENLIAYGYGHDNIVYPSLYTFYGIDDHCNSFPLGPKIKKILDARSRETA